MATHKDFPSSPFEPVLYFYDVLRVVDIFDNDTMKIIEVTI